MGREEARAEGASYETISSRGGPGAGFLAGGSRDAIAAQMRDMQGPFAADQQMRNALTTIWRMLPPDRRDAASVGTEARELLDRCLRDLERDAKVYGFAP
jgi:hypothetical protein